MVTPQRASRRIVVAGAGTAAGLVLLFAYPTSLDRSSLPAGAPGPASTGTAGGAGGTGTSSGTSSSGGVGL